MTRKPTTISVPMLFRTLRAVTGLYLLAYVTLHLLNLSLGLFSLSAMEAARPYLSGIWTGAVLRPVLIASLLVHFVLGLWAIYCRPSLTGNVQDVVQALSGLLVIPLLSVHAIGVSGLKAGNVEVTYDLVNRVFWLSNPSYGLVQVILISIVWVHGCAGFFMLLRSRPSMMGVLPWLYPLAVAVPVVALLGFSQAGRMVLAEGLGLVIEQNPLPDGSEPPPVDYAGIARLTDLVIYGSLIIGGLILVARGLRAWLAVPAPVTILTAQVGQITGQTGQYLLDAFHDNNQRHANLCSGRGRCGTCAVRIIGGDITLPHPTPLEQTTLDRIDHGPNVRLACQLPLEVRGTLEVERIHPPDYTFDAPRADTPPEEAPA